MTTDGAAYWGPQRLVQEDEETTTPKRTHTHTHTTTQHNPPVSHASLPTPGCISACSTVTTPDASSTGRRKLLSQPLVLGRCVLALLLETHNAACHRLVAFNIQDAPALMVAGSIQR